MRIYKRGGVYWLQWKGRHTLGTGDRKIAEVRALDIQRRALDPTYVPQDETPHTLDTALTEFRASRERIGRAPGTLRQYNFHFGHLTRILGNLTPLEAIDAAAIDGYLAARHLEGAADSTKWKELCSLRGALRLARRHGRYPHPIEAVMPDELSGASPRGTRHLSVVQVNALIAVLPLPRAAVVAFIAATGADWASVELAQKGDVKAEAVVVRGTKTSHRHREIPIWGGFRRWAALAKAGLAGGRFAHWGNVRRDLEVACRRAQVPRVTPRDLRRSHGMILRAAGVAPHLIGAMLGHADGRMAERVYGRLEPAGLAALMKPSRRRTGTKSVQRKPRSRKKAA